MANRVTVTRDNVSKVMGSLQDLIGQDVLIGIPDSGNARPESPINNAALGYIHEFGSPAANIPARPFLIPGVEKAATLALAQLRNAADAALIADTQGAHAALVKAGIIGESFARAEINDGNFLPLKPATIAARARGRGVLSRRASETQYLALVKGGIAPDVAQGMTGIRPLINTGSLRNSLTSVVRRK